MAVEKKDIEGYEGLYAITKDGKVWSYKTNKWLKPFKNIKGYLIVDLRKKSTRISPCVHKLVAQAFLPNPENKTQVNHIDGNKDNPDIKNLEWCTQSENMMHSYYVLGRKNMKSIICEETNKKYRSIQLASRETGIDASFLCKACQNKVAKAGGFHWRYA